VRRGPLAATALAPRGSDRDRALGPHPGALEADGARSPAASAPPRSRWRWREGGGGAAARLATPGAWRGAARLGRGSGRVREGGREGGCEPWPAVLLLVAVPRWRGAAASPKAERSGGEGGGGAQRRAGGGARDERRQRRERGRVGAVGARRGWVGERERKERCMKDKDAQSARHVIDICSRGGVWTCGERLKKFRDPKMHFRS